MVNDFPRSLLRGGLSAFGTTTAHTLRVQAGQHHGFDRFAWCFYIWIAAFAGMTVLMDYPG